MLKVKACNSSGIWNSRPASYFFRIQAPFWRSWWFYLLLIVPGLLGVFSLLKIRERHLKRRQRSLEEQVNSRTLELEKEKQKVEKINRTSREVFKEKKTKAAVVQLKRTNKG